MFRPFWKCWGQNDSHGHDDRDNNGDAYDDIYKDKF